MRLVQVLVPPETEEPVVELLEEEGYKYVVTDETSGRDQDSVISFVVPQQAVESVLDSVHGLGVPGDGHTIVMDVEVLLSEEIDDGEDDEDGSRISRQELRAHAEDMTPSFPVYLTLTLVSAIVATAGLLLDSPAVVVGSMVIAPLIGPALGASIGTVLDEEDLLLEGVRYQLIGVGVAIAAAAAFAFVVRYANVVPPGFDITVVGEIQERIAPTILALVIALGAGVAGILSIAAGVSVTLVGVMIAAALIPPAAVAGLALAFGEPMAALGATVLVSVNLLSVNLAGLATLWYVGYRPESIFAVEPARARVTRQVLGLTVVVLVFSAFLIWITYTSFAVGTFEEDARAEVAGTIAEDHEEYVLVGLTVEPGHDYPFLEPDRVVVTVAGPPGEPPPDLAADVDAAVQRHATDQVTVDVEFLVREDAR